MTPAIGLILTHASGPAALRAAIQAARADILKVVAGWGLDGGWPPAAVAEVAGMAPTLLVRSTWGDPSYDGGRRTMPYANQIAAEIEPWMRVRPDAWVELGNEPLIFPADEAFAWDYLSHLSAAIDEVRRRWPRAKIIAPAHMRNHPIRLGAYADGQTRWDALAGPTYRRCDALGLHAYSADQAAAGLASLRTHVDPDRPVWLTEFALNEALADDVRGRRYLALLAPLPVAAACLYHLAERGGDDPTHFNPHYTLRPGALAALAGRAQTPPPMDPATPAPDAARFTDRIDDFTMDVRQWRTVEAFRRHLRGYVARQVAAWATGVTVHHTVSPVPSGWNGVKSMLAMARFYRDSVDNGPDLPKGGWTTGPQLYIVAGAPRPADDGIWQLTPLNVPGTHAKSFNASRWGVEVVGAFDRVGWDPATAALALGALAALHDWAGWPAATPATLNGHRDDPKTTKTCPGTVIDLTAVRRGVESLRRGSV